MPDSILTVLTPAPDRLLATSADVAKQLMRPGEPPAEDFEDLISQASDTIATLCNGRTFGRESLREVFRGARSVNGLILARHPVAMVTTLVADSVSLIEGTDFEVDAPAGIVHRLSGDARRCWSAGKITVEYTAGWLLPSQDGCDLPGDVRRLCINRVARMWSAKGRDPSLRSESTEGIDSVSYFDPDKLSAEEEETLRGYRNVNL
jgi:hypothetical protein